MLHNYTGISLWSLVSDWFLYIESVGKYTWAYVAFTKCHIPSITDLYLLIHGSPKITVIFFNWLYNCLQMNILGFPIVH